MSRKRTTVQHGMQGVFVFVLLGLFAVMSTLMVLLGAQMYRNAVEHATRNNEDRVLGAYVRSMVRGMDSADSLKIENYDGVTALAMYDESYGDTYVTWLYCYDDHMYEQFTSRSDDFEPQRGIAICPAASFEPEFSGSLLTMRMVDGAGEPCTVQVALRCAQ